MKNSAIWIGGRNEHVYDDIRIPGIIVTNKGTLIVYGEARDYKNVLGGWGDWAAIDIVMKRSTDRGETWSGTKVLCTGTNPALYGGLRTMNNPVMIADGDIIHMLYCVNYGLERMNGGVHYIKSEDDGITWSKPENISASCHTDEYPRSLCATGPGHGIVLSKNSLSPGMIIVPVWLTPHSERNYMNHHPSVVSTLYSTDNGESWRLGEVIRASDEMPDPSETVAVELSDGRVMLNMRNESKSKRRAVTISSTGYDSWNSPEFDEALVDPICFGSIIRYDEHTILFVNCNSETSRTNLTVRASRDDGKTWEASKSIAEIAGYSDIAVSQDGTIYVLYEIAKDNVSINLMKFNLDFIYKR